MIKRYSICRLGITCDFRYELMQNRAEKYLSDTVNEDMIIPFSKEDTEKYRKAADLPDDELELMVTAEKFYRSLLRFDGFMLHSSAVAMDGGAYLFSAPSGTGKSTHTSLWLKEYGSRAKIINDDKPAIRIVGDGIYAYGTPWSGKSDLNLNEGFPLKGICILCRSETNFIQPLDTSAAIFAILDQTLRPDNAEDMDRLLDLLDKVIRKVRVWKMGCNISTEAAKLAFETMSNK